jgi:DNA invertase Pin-like site-specific DNA recombinase
VKTAIYIRNSLDRDMNKVSPEYQRTALTKLCRERFDCPDPIEYMDRGVSATKGTRPRYLEMCEDIANGVIGRVAVWDLDRLHRQPRELEDFIDLADKYSVELANVGGDVDLSTPSGRMFARMKGTVARYEVEQKSARQKAANAERAKRGKAWVMRSFGYDGDELVKHEADAIRNAYRDLLSGASLMSIADQWNTAGIKTVKGNEWSGGSVRQVLLRARNAGLQVRGTRAASAASKIHDTIETDDQGNPVKGTWPRIVTRDEWESACKLLADPKRHTGKAPGRKRLLTNIALCGVCGGTLSSGTRAVKSGGRKPTYQCKNKGCGKILRDLASVDAVVVDVITTVLARPDAVSALSAPTVDTRAIRDEINRLQAQVAAANAEYDDGIIDGRRLRGRIEQVTAKLGPLQDQLLDVHMSADVKALAGKADARKRFDALPLDRRRGVIDTLATVTVHPAVKGGRFDPATVTVEPK